MIDDLHEGCEEKKPKIYRQKASKLYLRFTRNRRPRKKQICRALREQLGFVQNALLRTTRADYWEPPARLEEPFMRGKKATFARRWLPGLLDTWAKGLFSLEYYFVSLSGESICNRFRRNRNRDLIQPFRGFKLRNNNRLSLFAENARTAARSASLRSYWLSLPNDFACRRSSATVFLYTWCVFATSLWLRPLYTALTMDK